MSRWNALSRRSFVGLGASAAVLSPLAIQISTATAAAQPSTSGDAWGGLKVGVATYSFSKLPLETTLKDLKRVGVSYVSIKDAHLPLKSTAEQRKAVVRQFLDAGLTPLSCGNIAMNNEADAKNAFEYARDAGIPTIVCKPTPELLPLLDKLVKEFNIKIAIHNHGPEDKVYPSPYEPWKAIQKYDERIGLCIDVGHTARSGVDPIEAIKKCAARLYDMHLKDLAAIETKSRVVEVGRGVLDIRGILRALQEVRFAGHVGLEHEKDMNDPLPGVAESIGYIRGVLAASPGVTDSTRRG